MKLARRSLLLLVLRSPAGNIEHVKVLAFREIRYPAFTQQFKGARLDG